MCCGCVPSGDARYVARVVGSGKDDLQGVDVQGEEEVEECILVCGGMMWTSVCCIYICSEKVLQISAFCVCLCTRWMCFSLH